jgi:uncharacterized protein YgiM (DUF1202 family)
MRKMIVQMVLVVVGVLFSTLLYAQAVYYVQSVKAKVMSGPSFKSAVIGEVSKGMKLAASGRAGSWMKVKFNDKDGYVSSLLVASHPPLEKTGVIKGEDAEIKQGVRRRASSFTSAAAARGLAQDDRRRVNTQEKADYDSVGKMEAFSLSDEEVRRFMEGSKL